MKKKRIIIIIIAATMIYTAAWMSNRGMIEERYSDGMIPYDNVTYTYLDDEGYSYNLKLPDYPDFTGNLCVTAPGNEVSFFIWPSISGKFEYGIQISDVDDGRMEITRCVMTDSRGTPIEGDRQMLNGYKETIDDIVERADNMWEL